MTFKCSIAAVTLTAATVFAPAVAAAAPLDAAEPPSASPIAQGCWDTGSSTTGSAGTGSAVGLPSYEVWEAGIRTQTEAATQYVDSRVGKVTNPAIVLDIDNTSLATWYCPGPIIPAIAPTLELAEHAAARGVAVFFVTGRPGIDYVHTLLNLKLVGFPVRGLYCTNVLELLDLPHYKSDRRAAIEKDGYTIVANIGNRQTDLDGGHAERSFALPQYPILS